MKTTLFLLLTVLPLTVVFLSYNHAQGTEPERLVRLIYFLPSDATPQRGINTKLDALIKDVQKFYANEMERHGHGRKSFTIETNKDGKVVVYRVKGQFVETYYLQNTAEKVTAELTNKFDASKNIYLIVIELANIFLNGDKRCGTAKNVYDGIGGGYALIPSSGPCVSENLDIALAAHELGHNFGLVHDFSSDSYIMSYGHNRSVFSACAAEWLSVHRYFNASGNRVDNPTVIKMLKAEIEQSNTIRFNFMVTDLDGLHQAQLDTDTFAVPDAIGQYELLACRSLTGNQSATSDFVTTGLAVSGSSEVRLWVMDALGNYTGKNFAIEGFSVTGPKIEGPWLWTIVPTGQRGGAAAAASGIDYIAEATDDVVTEIEIATNGATAGKSIGNSVWTRGNIAPTGRDNLTELVNTLGLGSADINNHVAYGSLLLQAPRRQQTTMYVGSDDAVKVWLNGKLVHNNPVNRGSSDYQDAFPVTLKRQRNVLLVAIYENQGDWSGFFGFEKDTKYKVLSPVSMLNPQADINRDGRVNVSDLLLVVTALGENAPTNARADVNADNIVNMEDLLIVIEHLNDPVDAAAPEIREIGTQMQPALLEAQLNALRAKNNGTLKYQRAIAFLDSLLTAARPNKTVLLANYPNPFNPETWIPYQLAHNSTVLITIYDTYGIIVRQLALGDRSAGNYTSRTRAAYWDGRNTQDEPVASGLYFYQLQTDTHSLLRKMVIKK